MTPSSAPQRHNDTSAVKRIVAKLARDPAAQGVDWSGFSRDAVETACIALCELLESELREVADAKTAADTQRRYAHTFKALLTHGEPTTYMI